MRSIEFSKQLIRKTVETSWQAVTYPWQTSIGALNSLLDIWAENTDDAEQRKIIAQGLTEIHQLLKIQHAKVTEKKLGEVAVYIIQVHEKLQIILYFQKKYVGYKLTIEELLTENYGKKHSRLYGPLYLAEHLKTVRSHQLEDGGFESRRLSSRQLTDIVEVMGDIFIALAEEDTNSALG